MRNRSVVIILTLALMIGSAVEVRPWGATAQQATPLPPGVVLEERAEMLTNVLPVAPARFSLERVGISPSTSTAQRGVTGPELLLVESGTVTVNDGTGLDPILVMSEDTRFQTGDSYSLTNTSESESVSILRFSVSPEADVVATGAGDTAPIILLAGVIESLSTQPSELSLSRMSWEPGAELSGYSFSGPVGLVIESGQLTITGRNELTRTIQAGESLILSPGVSFKQSNMGGEPTIALVASITDQGRDLVELVQPTPTVLPPTPTVPAPTTLPPTLESTNQPTESIQSVPPTETAPPLQPTETVEVVACDAIEDHELLGDESSLEFSGTFLHVEYWWDGEPERETILPGGTTYDILQPIKGWVWEYGEGCSKEEVMVKVLEHTERRVKSGANNAGYIEWTNTGVFEPRSG